MGIDHRNPMPLYIQIADDIRSKIYSNHLKEGDSIDSQRALALKYDVSLITVKKALDNLRQEGFLYSRVGKGTYVDKRKPSVDFSKNKTIGLVLRDLKDPFFSLIVHSAEEKASEKGYNLLISNTSNRVKKEEQQITHFRRIGVNGLIIASMSHLWRATSTILKMHEENFPYVVVSYMEDPNIYYVGTDHEQGAFMATEHLIKLGYKRIGYINAEEGNLVGELRLKGYSRALQQYEKPINKNLIVRMKFNNYQSGYEIGRQFSTFSVKPDAVFVYNDLSALGFEQAILEQGLKVPDDVAIVGFDDIERDQYAPVPLTTVQQPTDKIGAIAVDKIISRIGKQRTTIHTLLRPKLIVRDSCGVKLTSVPETGSNIF